MGGPAQQTASLFSIGYATKPLEVFLAQLRLHAIDAVADVRSVPYSKYFQDYRQDELRSALATECRAYVYLGRELGPRSQDPAHYDAQNQVQFDRLMRSATFLAGIERLRMGLAKGYRIALLCAEKDPAGCHRSLLIGYYWRHQLGQPLFHIHHDGDTETQQRLEQRLVREHGLGADLLTTGQASERMAYEERLKQTSYRKSA